MLGEDMLKGKMRGFVIKHKGVFMKAIIAFAKILEEPTKENTTRHNTHILIDIRDKYFKLDNLPARKELMKAIWKIGIVEYEHDGHYSFRGDWVLEEIHKSDWKQRPIWQPSRESWNEPLPEGMTLTKLELPQEIVEQLRAMGGTEGIPIEIIL